MTDVPKTTELIAEAQQHYSEMNGLNSRAAEVMMELVAALEAKTGVRVETQLAATRVPVQGEPNDDREALADRLARALDGNGGDDLGLAQGEGALHLALDFPIREAIEDVYADCGDSAAGVLSTNIAQRLAYLLPTALLAAFPSLSRVTVPDAATERERDDLETRLSEYLCDSTGGKLSKTGYDVRTMVAHTEDYYDGLHADARKEIEAERDAALAAVARVRAIHKREVIAVHPGVGEEAWCPACQEHWPCSTVAALDGAPEPKWEYGEIGPANQVHMTTPERVRKSEALGWSQEIVRRYTAGPWVSVKVGDIGE